MTSTLPRTSPAVDDDAHDEDLLALPLHDDHHRTGARAARRWTSDHPGLWSAPHPRSGAAANARGTAVRRALGVDGWFAHLHPDHDPDEAARRDTRWLCLVREALAHADDLADFAFSIQLLAAEPILRVGSADQRRRWLPGLADGTLAGSFALSEPDAGSDPAAVSLTARRSDDGFVLNGTKAWIAAGDTADVHCVLARTGEGPGALGLSLLLVPADTSGLEVEPVDASAPRSFAHLHLHDAPVPASALLGRPGRGYVTALGVLERFRVTVGAAALGFGRRAARASLARARTRVVGGAPLIERETVRADLADDEIALRSAALLVARASWELDHARPGAATSSAAAKLVATETAQRVVDRTVQLHGAAGIVADGLPERLYRQVRSLRIYEGASEVQRSIVADAVCRRTPTAGAV